MKRYYEVTLTTLAPVFIGSGEVLNQKEYVYDFHKKKVTVINRHQLIQELLKKEKLTAFTTFVSNGRTGRGEGLRDFFIQHKIDTNKMKSYELSVPDATDKQNLNTLSMFVKNGAEDFYIPGSSLKGALRTCILKNIHEDKKDNEIFRHLSISDSEPIKKENFAIYQKIDYSTEKKGGKGLPLYRECLKPNTKVTFKLSLDGKLTIDEVIKSIKETNTAYYQWSQGFKYGVKETKKNIIYLGGGSGFVSKTLHYSSKERVAVKEDIIKILAVKFNKGKWEFDKKLNKKVYKPGVYEKLVEYVDYRKREVKRIKEVPKNVPIAIKLAKHNNTLMEMGRCEIVFEEIFV